MKHEESVEYAKNIIQKFRSFVDHETYNEGRRRRLIDGEEVSMGELIEESQYDPEIYDAAISKMSDLLGDSNIDLDSSMRRWLAGVISGRVARPDARGSDEVVSRDAIITLIIGHLEKEYSIKPSRNDATPVHESGCDVVAEAMYQLDLKPDEFDGVRNIWKRFRRESKDKTDDSSVGS